MDCIPLKAESHQQRIHSKDLLHIRKHSAKTVLPSVAHAKAVLEFNRLDAINLLHSL